MPNRHSFASFNIAYLSPALKLLDNDLSALEAQGGGGSGIVTTTQAANGTWPAVVRVSGVTYRWQPTITPLSLPTRAVGALPGDELIGVGTLPASLA